MGLAEFILLPYTVLGWTFKWLFSIGMWFVIVLTIHCFFTTKIYDINYRPIKFRWPFYRD